MFLVRYGNFISGETCRTVADIHAMYAIFPRFRSGFPLKSRRDEWPWENDRIRRRRRNGVFVATVVELVF